MVNYYIAGIVLMGLAALIGVWVIAGISNNTEGQVTQVWLNNNGTINGFEIDGSTYVGGSANCIIPQTLQIGMIVHYISNSFINGGGCTITVIR